LFFENHLLLKPTLYSYNSYHKVITIGIVIAWAIFHFSGKSDDSLYYDNGQIKCSGKIVNALNQGQWIWYFEDGTIQYKGEFDKGERKGLWTRYNSKGHLISKSTYLNNKLNGIYLLYDENENISEKHIYKDDKLIERKNY